MAEFDLRQLNSRTTNGANNVDKIDTTAGKVARKGTYVTPDQARQMKNVGQGQQPDVDPIFDTPPAYKVNTNQGNIESLDVASMGGRTPVNRGKPPVSVPTGSKQPVVHSVTDPNEVPDPVSLKVVNNLAHKISNSELTPFDPSTLPKKKPEMGSAESEDMAKLETAVNKEMENISERVRALTDAQLNEYLDARENGRPLPKLMTDEEVAREEEERINKAAANESDNDAEESVVRKRIVIAGEDGEVDEVSTSNESKTNRFEEVCMNAIRHVDNHVTAKDYFTRAMHGKSYLAKNGIFSEIWAIVMYNNEGERAVHPFIVAKKDGIIGIVEANLDNIKGIHILDPNDTIDGLYSSFLHKGYMYEYIDFLAKSVAVKLPADMPTIENALKLANEKLREGQTIMEAITPVDETKVDVPESDELDNAIVYEEANSLYGNKCDDEVTTSSNDKAEYSITDNEPTYEIGDDDKDNVIEEPTIDGSSDSDDNDSLIISKSYDGDTAYESAVSDDLSKDLESELNVDVSNGRDDEAMLNELKDAVKQNIRSITKKINLREFDISDTPISASKVAGFSIKDINQADWVMPNAKRVITVSGLSGPELFAMNPQNTNKNKINTFRQIYGIMYKHVVSKKPKTFDEWLKVTRFSDIDHIYAALHRATFSGSNFVHYECPECNHVFIRDFEFEDMVRYESDEAKDKIHRILNSGDSSIAGYDVQLSQISNDYVVGLKDPSIWNMVMETAALSDDFLTKYEDLLDTMSFIDSIYVINRDTKKLDPVDFGYDQANPAKSTARKIMILSDIIKTLSSDSYFDLRNQIVQLFSSSSNMTYQIPEAECPRCKHKFAAEPTEGVRLLFTRHQLGALGAI